MTIPTTDLKDSCRQMLIAAKEAEESGGANIVPLDVSENGTYTPSEGVDGFSPVTVNVSGGSVGDVYIPPDPESWVYPSNWIPQPEAPGPLEIVGVIQVAKTEIDATYHQDFFVGLKSSETIEDAHICYIDWGDGTVDDITSIRKTDYGQNYDHNYTTEGFDDGSEYYQYIVKVTISENYADTVGLGRISSGFLYFCTGTSIVASYPVWSPFFESKNTLEILKLGNFGTLDCCKLNALVEVDYSVELTGDLGTDAFEGATKLRLITTPKSGTSMTFPEVTGIRISGTSIEKLIVPNALVYQYPILETYGNPLIKYLECSRFYGVDPVEGKCAHICYY